MGAILQSPCPSVCPSVRSHFRNRYLSFYWKKWFYIWYMALTWWLVPCLSFPGLPHIYFLFTVRLRFFMFAVMKTFVTLLEEMIWYLIYGFGIVTCTVSPLSRFTEHLLPVYSATFHVCCNENFRNSYLSFYWKNWSYIWYMALAWWLVQFLPFPGLPHIYFLFTVRLTNEQVGIFLARRSVQQLVVFDYWLLCRKEFGFLCLLRRSRADWSKCFICQEDKHEALKSPEMKIYLAKSGYRNLSKNISESTKCQFLSIYVESTKEMEQRLLL